MTHYENVVGVQSWKSKKELESLREEPKRETWSRHPAIVNAWYSPSRNSISKYRKVTSSNTSLLDTHAGFFRLLTKGIFDPYICDFLTKS